LTTWLGPLWFAIIAKIFDKQIGLRADFPLSVGPRPSARDKPSGLPEALFQ